jgi:tetratricopeptide (TPR) repeat protein
MRRNLGDAKRMFLVALEIRKGKAPGSLDVAASLNNLGEVARNQGDLTWAREYHLQALEIQKTKAPGSLDVAASLNNLGEVARNQGDLAGALDRQAEAWVLFRNHASAVTGDEAWQAFGSRYGTYATDLVRTQIALGEMADALETLEQSRAQALLQMLALRGMEERLDDPELWKAYRRAESEFQKVAKRLAEAADKESGSEASLELARSSAVADEIRANEATLAATRAERERVTRDYTRARVEMEERLAEVRRAVPALRDDPVSLEEARRVLPPESLWVAFSVGEKEAAVFLVPATPGAPISAYVVPSGRKVLAEKVAAIADRVRSNPVARAAKRQNETALATASRELFGLLFPEEVRAKISQARRLMISPEGPLWDLPFSMLVSNASGEPRWLGLEKPLSYQQSLSAYVREGERAAGGASGVLIVGNPSFGATATMEPEVRGVKWKRRARKATSSKISAAASPVVGGEWRHGERSYFALDGKAPAPLPGTAAEAKELAVVYGVSPMLGPAATEAAVRDRIGTAGTIHLATHGYFNPTVPMASGVLLAAPAREPELGATDDDGVLQAWEFARLRLKADMVVLSACETGRGEKVQGEGLVGLTHSVQMAGARRVVATHWRIEDQASKDLMVSFHRRVRAGMAADEALREAMAEARSRNATQAPYYWAGFFLAGEPTAAGGAP